MEAKRKEFEDKNKWNAQRFPDCWLAWYVYGPPKCGGHHLFESSEMQHLTKVKARRTLSKEQETTREMIDLLVEMAWQKLMTSLMVTWYKKLMFTGRN